MTACNIPGGLTDDERAVLVQLVRKAIVDDTYPLASRLAILNSALAKLDPAPPAKPRLGRPPLSEAPMRGHGDRRTSR
jgi:hypothetical protein